MGIVMPCDAGNGQQPPKSHILRHLEEWGKKARVFLTALKVYLGIWGLWRLVTSFTCCSSVQSETSPSPLLCWTRSELMVALSEFRQTMVTFSKTHAEMPYKRRIRRPTNNIKQWDRHRACGIQPLTVWHTNPHFYGM